MAGVEQPFGCRQTFMLGAERVRCTRLLVVGESFARPKPLEADSGCGGFPAQALRGAGGELRGGQNG